MFSFALFQGIYLVTILYNIEKSYGKPTDLIIASFLSLIQTDFEKTPTATNPNYLLSD
jgi:hypothetical protein